MYVYCLVRRELLVDAEFMVHTATKEQLSFPVLQLSPVSITQSILHIHLQLHQAYRAFNRAFYAVRSTSITFDLHTGNTKFSTKNE